MARKIYWKIEWRIYNILSGEGNPAEKFWMMENRIKNDKKSCGVSIEINKNNLPFDLVSLIKDNVISVEDIKIFSEEIQEKVNFILNLW